MFEVSSCSPCEHGLGYVGTQYNHFPMAGGTRLSSSLNVPRLSPEAN